MGNPTTDRVLTIRQPWADLIMSGVKDVENRTWPVPSTLPQWYRCTPCGARERRPARSNADHDCSPEGTFWRDGPFPFRLWIHAAKRDDLDQRGWFEWCRVRELNSADFGPVPDPDEEVVRGALLGSVTVTGCHPADGRSCFEDGHDGGLCSPWAERSVWHWTLAEPAALPEPIPLRGRQGLWTLDDEALEMAGWALALAEGITA